MGWIRVRSPLLTESRLLSLPGGTEMVLFPPFASMELCIHSRMTELHSAGLPHSEIPGSTPACGSPRLIAACHVLHRLSSPRHLPCTLKSLTKLECLTNRRILSLQLCLQTYKFDSVINEHRLQDHWDPLLRVSRSGASPHSKEPRANWPTCRPSGCTWWS